ncbi:hypothetical protein [Spirosoma migulaei]
MPNGKSIAADMGYIDKKARRDLRRGVPPLKKTQSVLDRHRQSGPYRLRLAARAVTASLYYTALFLITYRLLRYAGAGP